MPKIKDILKKNKNPDLVDWKGLAMQVAEQVIGDHIGKMEAELKAEARNKIDELAKKLTPSLHGEDGKDGRDGIDGAKGEPGKDGLPGKDGRDGRDGIDGKDGLQGEPGKDGKNGSPDKPIEIATKLNTLTEKVEKKVIKGLNETIRRLERAIQSSKSVKAGGGMGNWVAESFAVSSVTTTVTLANNVAVSGNAIWVSYNGQYLVPGTGFTISGKVITLLFTPIDDTFVDVLYVRT